MNQTILLWAVLLPAAAAPLAYALGRCSALLRKLVSALTVLAELALSLFLILRAAEGEVFRFSAEGICGMGISLELDGFRAIHLVLAALLWTVSGAFQLEYASRLSDQKEGRYTLFTLLTLSATMGVFLSADLYTTFLFFEVMSFTSYVWVLHDGREQSKRAAETYLGVSVIAGMVMLMGLFLLYQAAGTLSFEGLSIAAAGQDPSRFYLAGALILVGFGAKAGMYPLHIWVPKAYPAAPAPASALLSGILSKAGIYGILVISSKLFLHDGSWGMAILLIGAVTMFWGGLTALFSMDFKKIIASSSMSQIGFILVGIGAQGLLGAENALAVRGTILHIVNHSLLKLVLFLLTGVVFLNLKKYTLNEIRGFGRGKPFFAFAFLTAALGISGVPFFNGYVSKTLLHESLAELSAAGGSFFTVIEWVFLLSGGLTAAYMIKLFVALFLEKGKGEKSSKGYLSPLSKISILIPCVLMLGIGLFPQLTAEPIAALGEGFLHGGAMAAPFQYFSLMNLKGAGISLLFGILFYLIIVRRFMMRRSENGKLLYVDRWPEHFDLETMVYRPLVQVILPAVLGAFSLLLDKGVLPVLYRAGMALLNGFAVFFSSLTDGIAGFFAKYVFCTRTSKKQQKITKPIAYETGVVLDQAAGLWARLFHRERRKRSYAETMQHYEEESAVRRKMISASLSYGLLFCGIGLVIVLLYLLLS